MCNLYFECFVSTDNLWKGAAAAGALVAAGVAIAVEAGAAAALAEALAEAKARAESFVAAGVALAVAVGGGGASEEAARAGTAILLCLILSATVLIASGIQRNTPKTRKKSARLEDFVAEVATHYWKLIVRQFLKTDMVKVQIYPKLIEFTVWFAIISLCKYAFFSEKNHLYQCSSFLILLCETDHDMKLSVNDLNQMK